MRGWDWGLPSGVKVVKVKENVSERDRAEEAERERLL